MGRGTPPTSRKRVEMNLMQTKLEAALTEEGKGGAPSVFIVVLWQSRSISLAGKLHSSWKCAT